MMKLIVFFLTFTLVSTNEHWFVFDRYRFSGFETSLLTLTSSENNSSLLFTLSTYDRSILVNYNNEIIRLNIHRADLLHNTIYHTVFLAIQNGNRFETYVNCKLIDSYLFYTPFLNHDNSTLIIKDLHENIQHYEIKPTGQLTQQEIFDSFSCKQINPSISSEHPASTTIGRTLIRKMQHVIEKVQQRNLRSRRQNNRETLSALVSNSLTIIYKPNIDTNTSPHSIFTIRSLNFHINYYPTDNLFSIQFNLDNRTQYLLYADKSTDVIFSSNQSRIIFLHLTSTMISCYINCELIDQELITDTAYIENFIGKILSSNQQEYQYNVQSTLLLSNKLIDQVAANFFCTKLDKKYQDLLPDKYTLRKFINALDILAHSLDTSGHNRVQNVSTIDIPPINGYGSLKEFTTVPPTIRSTTTTKSIEVINTDKACSTDDDCNTTKSALKCQSGQCLCPKSFFWSSTFHRCIECRDISIGNRCFRLSSHKSTWYEANDYCQDEEGEEYSMKFVSNLNQTDIQYLKENYLHNNANEHVDYMYWLGATSHFNTRQLHGFTSRRKRDIPTQIFRWYDTGETAQLNIHDLWCSQSDYASLSTINNNQLCVSLTSCGLYADDCQRNYRFLCQAV